MRNIFVYLFFLGTLFIACEKEFIADGYSEDPSRNFDYLWDDFENRYAFFELKGVDWSRLYDSFNQFVSPQISKDSLFSVMGAMLYSLQDGHVNIVAPFNRSRNWSWFEDFPENFNESVVYRNYFKQNYKIIGPFDCVILDSVLYVYYGSFADGFTNAHLNAILTLASKCKGVVIDIRNNTGGSSGNAFRLASLFTDKELEVGKRRIKVKVNSYSSWEPITVSPYSSMSITVPVVLLTNRKTYSAANNFTLMMKSMPNVIHMGDKSGGGGGTPVFNQLPNGWTYRFSATQTIDLNNQLIENGIEPDRYVATSIADELIGIDSIIEEALKILR